ncbi:MAG: carboxymuconolactone decarboxylase [Hyphomicrobiaceae bacterium]|nr:carboxymuconolactone decarboxylase [Hyphomicrobiaceae bacterium]
MARLPDPTASLTGDDRAIYDDIVRRRAAKGVHHLGPYIPLLNHPQLAKRIEQLGFFYKYESDLPRDIYQFVVLEVGRQSGVEFIWRDHLEKAREAGVPDGVIDGIASGAHKLDEPYQMVREVMGWAFRFKSIPVKLQGRTIDTFGMNGFLEIVTLCGFYTMIGMVNACFDVPLPKGEDHA